MTLNLYSGDLMNTDALKKTIIAQNDLLHNYSKRIFELEIKCAGLEGEKKKSAAIVSNCVELIYEYLELITLLSCMNNYKPERKDWTKAAPGWSEKN